MWSRKRIDIGWSDLLAGVYYVCFSPPPASVSRRVEAAWPDAERTLACLSVRSGFDLLLSELALPRGSEVLVSAITIPDMVRIIEHHGLTPVPVDLMPETMAPSIDQWRRAISPATRAILVAHMFGGRLDIEPIVELAARHELLVFEDCAQAFAGTLYQGHPRADVSMFSFGVIKSSTALGGGVLRVRDVNLLRRMRRRQATYTLQTRGHYLKRLLKYAGMKFLACRPVCGCFAHLCRAIGFNYDRWVNRAARGFPGAALIAQIRRRPNASLMGVLERRLRNYNALRWQRHSDKGRTLAKLLIDEVSCPGANSAPHTYWVFPVVVDSPKRMLENLIQAGFDATQGQSLCVVPPSDDRPSLRAVVSEQLLSNILFLPFYPELTARESQRMADVVLAGTNHKEQK
ncbi:MAG: DegT/DnrJ/EryC1/StrS family aminotransferase [Pirellulales bacterium]|nr:DegT/DnrJ/EryC1/StrS family aminotransferase [Pirellulales bacterium]